MANWFSQAFRNTLVSFLLMVTILSRVVDEGSRVVWKPASGLHLLSYYQPSYLACTSVEISTLPHELVRLNCLYVLIRVHWISFTLLAGIVLALSRHRKG